MEPARLDKLIRRAIALVAVLFGGATLIEGSRVLGGADPGYIVFRPLLIYNVLMGLVYVAAGVLAWRKPTAGKRLAGIIALLNALVLAAIVTLYLSGAAVAVQSVAAMTLRTVVWAVLFAGLAWLAGRDRAAAAAPR